MTEIAETPVTTSLEEKNIPFRVFQHTGPIKSLEQAAQERGQRPSQVVRSIVFRLAKGNYAMVLIAGPEQISWRALRNYLGKSRLTMAKREEILQITGYELGAVSPFGLPTPLRTLIDESVLAEDEISIGSGKRGLTVILKSEDMLRGLENAEIGRFKE